MKPLITAYMLLAAAACTTTPPDPQELAPGLYLMSNDPQELADFDKMSAAAQRAVDFCARTNQTVQVVTSTRGGFLSEVAFRCIEKDVVSSPK
jgi:hypothetical protein